MLNLDALPPSYNPGQLDGNDIRRLMARSAGWAIVEPKLRILDDEFTPLVLPAGKNPNDPTDCLGYTIVNSVEMNASRDVHRQCDLVISRIPGIDFNPVRQYIRVSVAFYDPSRSLLLDVPVGTFGFQIPDVDYSSAQTIWQITGYDAIWDVRAAGFRNFYTPPAGMAVTDIVQDALMADTTPPFEGGRQPSQPYQYPDANNPGLTPGGCDHSGLNWPRSRLHIPPSTQALPAATPFDWKTNQLVAWNGLLSGITYWPLWADELAAGWTGQQPYFTQSLPQAVKEYSTLGTSWGPSVIKNVKLRVTDQTTIANVIIVLSENNSQEPIYAVAENFALDSDISIPNRGGKRVQRTIQNDKISNQSTADFAAAVELQWAAAAAEAVSFDSAIDPFHQVHEPVALNVWSKDRQIHEIDSSVMPFLETYWKIDFKNKLQSHTVQKSVRV